MESKESLGTPLSVTAPNLPSALIRNLPFDVTEELVRLTMIFSDDLTDVGILPLERSASADVRSAVVRFKTFDGAQDAKSMLDGRPYERNSPNMIVEIL